jgi:hypothetical protein
MITLDVTVVDRSLEKRWPQHKQQETENQCRGKQSMLLFNSDYTSSVISFKGHLQEN